VIRALGVDVGTTNTKVAVVEIAGPEIRELRVLRRPTAGDGDGIRTAVRGLVRDAVETLGGAPVAAIGIASMAETGALLDADGRSLGGLLRWDAALPGGGVEPGLRERTGVPRPEKSTRALVTAALPGRPGAAAWAGGAELAALALTGRAVTDPTLALRTMLAPLPPVGEAVAWDDELLAATGLPRAGLPAILAPGETVALDAAAARSVGLPAGIPVAIAGHDHAVATWATGRREPGGTGDSIGTAEALVRIARGAVDRAAAVAEGMSVGRTVDGRHETLVGGIPAASRLLAELAGRVGGEESADAFTGPIVLPTPSGRQAPRPDAAAVLRAITPDGAGAAIPRDPAAAARAASAGLALQARWIAATQDALLGERGTGVCVVGAAHAVAGPWWAAKRRLSPAALSRTAGIAEPVAAGAALLAAVRAGIADPGIRLPLDTAPSDLDPRADALLAAFVAASLDHALTTQERS
jgi:xylulokinase